MRARLVVVAFLATGCVRTHLQHDAPGNIDVRARPEHPESRVAEIPRDPGERMVVTSLGPYAGIGLAAGGDRDGQRSNSVGVEGSILYGVADHSHNEDDFFIYPLTGVGLNLGANLLTRERTGPSTTYAELQYHDTFVGVAGGWAWDPRLALSGPQATVFAGPLYLRSTTLLNAGTDVQIGLFFKLPAVWVWSR